MHRQPSTRGEINSAAKAFYQAVGRTPTNCTRLCWLPLGSVSEMLAGPGKYLQALRFPISLERREAGLTQLVRSSSCSSLMFDGQGHFSVAAFWPRQAGLPFLHWSPPEAKPLRATTQSQCFGHLIFLGSFKAPSKLGIFGSSSCGEECQWGPPLEVCPVKPACLCPGVLTQRWYCCCGRK